MINSLLSVLADAATAADSTAIVPSYEQVSQSLVSPEFYNLLLDSAVSLAKRLATALVVFFIGKMIINWVKNLVFKIMEKKGVEPSLSSFCKSLINVVLYFTLIIIIIDILGLETSSFVALFASAGVAIGMALSGTLQNFAGGVMLLLFRPFKIGDYIVAQGNEGVVKEIQIFNTIINTADGKTIIMPNGALSTNIMVNVTANGIRRVEWTFGIAYGDNVDEARNIILSVLAANEKVLKDPAIYVAVKELNSSSVDFCAHGWVKCADYWGVLHGVNEAVYKEFNKKGINIPFPQMDVHVIGEK